MAKAVGKTATASQRAATVHQLDDPGQRAIAEADVDRLLSSRPPVLIDEWQYLPQVWDRVRREVDAGATPGQFLLTGSSSPQDAGTQPKGTRLQISVLATNTSYAILAADPQGRVYA